MLAFKVRAWKIVTATVKCHLALLVLTNRLHFNVVLTSFRMKRITFCFFKLGNRLGFILER